MKCFLLKMKINGIKSIKEEIVLDFYNNSVGKQFDSFDSHVKAIYGANGAGKTAIIYAVEIYKNLILEPDYLAINNVKSDLINLNNLINQELQRFDISMLFAIMDDDGNVDSIFEHSVTLKKVDEKYILFAEKLNKIIGTKINDTTKYKLIYSVENGVLTLHEKCKIKDEIIDKTKNMLTSQTALLTILLKYKEQDEIGDDLLENALLSTLTFVNSITVVLQDSDKNYINLEFLINQMDVISKLKNDLSTDIFLKLIYKKRISNNTMERVTKEEFDAYEKLIKNLCGFIKIFKPDLETIEISKEERDLYYECKNILVYKDGRRIDKKFESTGIKKLISLYSALCEVEKGAIVFIDEFDANIHDVLLVKLVDYIMQYAQGQFVFTTHNLAPMDILQTAKHSIDFLSSDSRLVSWKKNGNYKASSLYSKGLIEYSPFNLEAFDFLGVFGDDSE